jgi:APA family basic amino acid/polyamine antiporter
MRVVYTEWLFFAMLAAGILVLRRRNDYRPRFKTPGYPFVPSLFILAAISVVINQIRADPGGSAIGLGLILLGVPVYFVWSHRGFKKATADAGH